MGNIQTLADVLAMIRRRGWLIALVVVLGALGTLILALRQPHVWESAAVLQVELPRISADVARAEAVSSSSQRLQLLEQELTSRDSMLSLIDAHGLFAEFPAMTPTEKVVALRRSIRIETIRSAQSPFGAEQPVSAMLILVQLGERQGAADIANALAQQVLDRSAERQSERVRETLDFYNREEERLAAAMTVLETEATAFKNANVDALPEGMQARREEIGRVDATLRDIDLQLLDISQELSALRTNRTPRALELRQIAALQLQLDGLEGQRRQIMERRVAIEAAINRAPSVETQLGTFNRRLQQLQEQYSVITRQRAEAETSQRLDSERQTERFEILETALPADYPLASGRRKLMVFGIFGSLMLGLGLALVQELRNPVLRSARQFQRALDLRPVIVLPDMGAPPKRRRGGSARKAVTWSALLVGATAGYASHAISAVVARAPRLLATGSARFRD